MLFVCTKVGCSVNAIGPMALRGTNKKYGSEGEREAGQTINEQLLRSFNTKLKKKNQNKIRQKIFKKL